MRRIQTTSVSLDPTIQQGCRTQIGTVKVDDDAARKPGSQTGTKRDFSSIISHFLSIAHKKTSAAPDLILNIHRPERAYCLFENQSAGLLSGTICARSIHAHTKFTINQQEGVLILRLFWFSIGYLLLSLAPLAIAVSLDFPARSIRDELAAGLVMVALAVLLLEFVLSGRFRIVSRRVGLDVTMRVHQLLARLAFILILVHPFLYATPQPNYPRPDDPTRQFTLGLTGWSATSGALAWLLALILILTAIFRDSIGHRYQHWRRMHGIGALLVVMLSVHHALAAGRYSREPALFWFWLVLLGVAGLSLTWVYLVRPLAQRRRPYAVKSVRRIALETWELVVSPIGVHRLVYEAGQFVWLKVGCSPFSVTENPFSISSAPGAGRDVAFVIKELGDFTNGIGDIREGEVAYLDGPHGNLTLKGRKASGIALLAGGVGIAPLIGILRQLALSRDRRPIILVYGNRLAEQIVYAEEIEELRQMLDLRIEHVIGEPQPDWKGRAGQIDAACIRDLFSFNGARDWLYVLCGPPGMISASRTTLRALRVPSRRILSERFNYD